MTINLHRNESVGTVNSVSTSATSGSVGRKRPPVFPQKLYDMLENAERDGYSHIISWMPDGKSFKIHVDPTSSCEKSKEDEEAIVAILKKTFNQTRYKSFLRQIQLYGFQRVYKGPQKGECSHELFVRGQRDLLYRKSIEDFQNVSNSSIAAKSRSPIRSPKRTVHLKLPTGMVLPPPPPLLREVTPDLTLSLQQRDATGPSPDNIRSSSAESSESETDFAWPFQQFCGSGPIHCSSRRGSQCQYLATSQIPTRLLNLVVPDSDDDDDENVFVDAKSKRDSADKSKRRSSSILSLALKEEEDLNLERRRSSCRSSMTSKSERRRSSMSILSLAMSEDFGLELENSISLFGNLSLGLEGPMTAELGRELERFVAEDCEDAVVSIKSDASIKRDAATRAQILPQAA